MYERVKRMGIVADLTILALSITALIMVDKIRRNIHNS